MATFEQCQAEYDAQTPPEPAWQSEYENLMDRLDSVKHWLSEAEECHYALMSFDGYDKTELRVELNTIANHVDEMIKDYGGRITYSRKQSG